MSTQQFNIATAQTWFSLLRARFAEKMDRLNELDSAVGDGDHGHTVARAFAAVETAVLTPFSDLGTLFDAAAAALAESSGGAIGPLLASLFAEGGVVFKGESGVETAVIAQFFAGGLAAIQAVGGAKPGQKTMLDALAPAVDSLQTHANSDLATALTAAANTAEKGAISTRDMIATHGRAHFLGDRSQGYQDAGATSMSIMIASLLDAVKGETAPPTAPLTDTTQSLPPGKLINHPDTMIAEELEGLAMAHPKLVKLAQPFILTRAVPKATGKVGLAIGHGGGHTPSMGGFV
ncbi:MAG: dihydroxyacetone kinase subunit L, partial [Chloroflexi bacterium]